jgi:hypothetical protein
MLMASTTLAIKDKHFLEVFDSAATKTLSELGSSVQTAILFHAGKIEGIDSSDVLKDPLKFGDAIEKIFSSGSSVLEDRIIDSMCTSLGIPPLNIGGTFEQKIAALYASAFAKKTNGGKLEGGDQLATAAALQSVSYEAL